MLEFGGNSDFIFEKEEGLKGLDLRTPLILVIRRLETQIAYLS